LQSPAASSAPHPGYSPACSSQGRTEKRRDGVQSNKQAKATSLALSWPRNTLLDDPASKIGIDRSLHGPLDGNDETDVGNAVLTRELGERPGLEDAQKLYLVL
jgi:hypothetical protein